VAKAKAAPRPPVVPPLLVGATVVGVVLTLLVVQRMGARSLVLGSWAGHWVYPYVRLFSWELLTPFAIVLATALGLLWLSRRAHEKHEWPTVAVWLVAAVPMQLALRWHAIAPLAAIVQSDKANSFYSPTLRFSAGELMARYMEIVTTLPPHARTNMAGKTMVYFLLRLFTDSPEALGVLVVVLSNLGALFVYLITRDLLEDKRAALYALILYVFVPGKLFFFPILNVLAPVPILASLWLCVRFVKGVHWAYAALMGPALYLTVFFEPLPLVMGLAFLGVLGLGLRRGTVAWKGAAQLVGIALAAFLASHALMRFAFGYDLFANFAYVFEDARHFSGQRPYGVWVKQNLWDFAISSGVASLTLAVTGAFDAARGGLSRAPAVLALSGLAVLAFLDLAGINRGEIVRLWIFIAGFLQIVPAWLCARAPAEWPFATLLGATVLQAAVGAGMVGFVRP
jgi:methylthioxylose transferase